MKFLAATTRAALALLVLASLGGCVVVPAHRYYGYGYGPAAEVEVDVAVPVVVGPRRPGYWHRHHRGY